jgi:tetratricopeptide (TPR) repeat protein
MHLDTLCPSPELLRRSLDPDDPMADGERQRVEAHVGGCDRGCKQAIDALMRGNTLGEGPETVPPASAAEASPTPPSGGTVPVLPGYEILGELGRGGMGVVYRARQTALDRVVALKMLRRPANRADAEEHERFTGEALAIARLNHVGIVHVYELGRSGDVPFIAMELAEGGSLAGRLGGAPQPPREAAALVARLADAVEAAHRRRIIHRDLKPANVLLAADGAPKVSDFGLAKQLDAGPNERDGRFLGTASYAAPEQAQGRMQEVGPATDVYGLGAILYEMLTGRPPFRAATTWQTLQQVVGSEPVPPGLLAVVPRDLETVCLKCLAKEPAWRYASAQALAEDLRRFLAGEPIAARPVGALERAAKWARRRPAVAGLLAALAVLAVGSVAGLTALYLRAEDRRRDADTQRGLAETHLTEARAAEDQARQEKGRAETQAQRAGRVLAFLTDHVLTVSRPKGLPGGLAYNVSLLEALDSVVPKIAETFADSPEDEATVCYTLATTYSSLGQFAKALPLHERALALRRRLLGPDHPDTLIAMSELSNTLEGLGRPAEAEALDRERLAAYRRVHGPDHPDTLIAMGSLAYTLGELGRYGEAEELQRECLTASRRVNGPEHPDTLTAMSNLVSTLRGLGRYAEAEELSRQCLAVRRRLEGPEHPDTLIAMGNLAITLAASHQYVEAEELSRECLAASRRVNGPDHPLTLTAMCNLAITQKGVGRLAEAESLQRECLASWRRVSGPDHPDTLTAMSELASVMARLRRYAEAEELWRECLAARRRVSGPDHPVTLTAMCDLADTLEELGRMAEAEVLQRECLAARRRVFGPDHPLTLTTMSKLAYKLGRLGRPAEAEVLQRECLAGRRRINGPEHPDTINAMGLLAATLGRLGRLPEAEALWRECLAAGRRVNGPEHFLTLAALGNLAVTLDKLGRPAEAIPLRHEYLAAERKHSPPDKLRVASALMQLGSSQMHAHKAADAEPVLRECLTIRRGALPQGDGRTADTESLLGDCLLALGRLDEAESLLLSGYEGLRAAKDTPPTKVREARARLACFYAWVGRWDLVEECLADARK